MELREGDDPSQPRHIGGRPYSQNPPSEAKQGRLERAAEIQTAVQAEKSGTATPEQQQLLDDKGIHFTLGTSRPPNT
jgi:hypothetical protein